MNKAPLIENLLELIEKNQFQKINKLLISNYKKSSAEGSCLKLKNTAELPLDLRICGNMKQDTREGYNKLNLNNSLIINGLTITNNQDGTITIDGTPTSGTQFNLSKEKLNLELNTDYIVSIKHISGTATLLSGSLFVLYYEKPTTTNGLVFKNGNETPIFQISNTPDRAPYLWFGFTSSSGASATFNNYRISIQIEKGKTVSPFEQFGQKPSLDFPSEIECGEAYNILHLVDMPEMEYNGLKVSIKDNVITLNGSPTKNTDILNLLEEDIELETGDYYLMYKTENPGSINSGGVYITDDTNKAIGNSSFWNDANRLISVEGKFIISKKQSHIYLNANYIYNNTKQTIMLVKKKVRDEFLPYGTIQAKIQDRNYFDISNMELGKLNWETGLPADSDDTRIRTKTYIPLKAGVWKLSFFGLNQIAVYRFDSKKQIYEEDKFQNWLETQSKTIELKEDGYITCTFSKTNLSKISISDLVNPILYSQEQKFQLYLGNRTLYGNNDTRDYFDVKIDEDLYNCTGYKKIIELMLIKNWAKYVIKNSDVFIQGTPSNRYYLDVILNNKNYFAISNYLKSGTENNFSVDNTIVLQNNRINIMTNDYTVEQLNLKLQELNTEGNPLYVIYQLKVPEEELISDSKLIEQFENMINNAQSYAEETNVSSDAFLKIDFYKDKVLELEERVKNLENK